MAQPRILLVGQALGGGGAETRFHLLARILLGGATDVAVLTGRTHEARPRVVYLGWHGKMSYLRVIWRLRQVLKAHPYDVVMSFGMFPNIVSALAIRALKTKPRLVMNEITRPIAQSRDSGWARSRGYTWLRRRFYPAADLLTANSIDGLTEACMLAGIPESRATRTPNVVDLAELRRRAESPMALPEYPYFICVARLDFMKRIDTVIDAWSQLKGATTTRLLVVGDGEARETLQARVKSLELQGQVVLMGALSEPMPLLRRARGFILASEYEGFSNAVLEAMCLDVPVITSLCSSDARQMCEQHAALGFDVGASSQLARHVDALEASADLRADLVRNAAAYRAPHLVPTAIHAYEALLMTCVSGTDARGGQRCAA